MWLIQAASSSSNRSKSLPWLAGPLYSGGGQDGEEVHKELVQKDRRSSMSWEEKNTKTIKNRGSSLWQIAGS